MSVRRDHASIAPQRDSVGETAAMVNLPAALSGAAHYVNDIEPPGTLFVAMLRSPHAHALVRGIDVAAARALPGVHAVLTGAEVLDRAGPHPVYWQLTGQRTPQTRAMAVDRVRYHGQVVAAVAAESRALAEDALELIAVDYEPLPVVATVAEALAPGAPLLVPEWPDNVFGEQVYGTGDTDRAFADAAYVVEEEFDFGRSFGAPLETRGCVVEYEPVAGRFEVWINSQSPNRVREVVSEVLGVPQARVRVRIPAVGGGFGTKANYYGEEILACLLARSTGRPVKYVEDRDESFVASSHARQQHLKVALAADADGRIVGLRGDVVGTLGGELSSVGMGPVWLAAVSLPGAYRIENIRVRARGVMTNRSPYGSYRGWGAPKAVFAIERTVDRLARTMGLDPQELRRRNLVTPEEMPYANGILARLDSGDYRECLSRVEALTVDAGWPDTIREARSAGRRVGMGYACFVESTGIGPSRVMSAIGVEQAGFDEAVARMDADGQVTVYTGQAELGQGILTTIAQTVAHELGLPPERVEVVSGDTDRCPYTGYGTAGSRGAAVGCEAARLAGVELRDQVLGLAADRLEADPAELVMDEHGVGVRGVPGRRLTHAEIGRAAYRDLTLAGDGFSGTLQGRAVYDPTAMTYSYGAAAALVEVDAETGEVRLLDGAMVDDCGVVINPDVVEGQLVGGSVQALAGALFEELVYDADARLTNPDFHGYRLPRTTDFPPLRLGHMETPSPASGSGVKGVGEAGTLPWAPALCAAVDDALADTGVFVTEVPLRPERLLEAIDGSGVATS
ncbi:xanthine dehydrogenase family protein molybdopterin-binding subunit [Nocardioides sp. LMS-CY]|uniref:xanthine dehydrogenase family protein molybdopterin-binding subunit n=1 Tax=Nocardioides sp. (strain LMS-CY) TaxID=2840457 RepID=UPI001C00735D|nr:xanthine dehydrogenase family protein molybdopterin-binding subunit [Nocardioides sp. LMS-CY]QWF20041.1 xanthine dehydrogenase family protein molybdopterin-binding subunit [Nocardioides sp. LMS-CY]